MPQIIQDLDPDSLARKAYAAYGESTGNNNFQGNPMPAWEELSEAIQAAWRAAAEKVMDEVIGRWDS